MNYKIAVIEDEQSCVDTFKELISNYAFEKKMTINVSAFSCVEDFLTSYTANLYNVIFFDIELPGMNGMDGAAKIREIDQNVSIIFLTRLAQYAIAGYKVHALNYILKPLQYSELKLTMERLLSFRPAEQIIPLKVNGTIQQVDVMKISYIESQGHDLIYHFTDGNEVKLRDKPLKKVASELQSYHFSLCSNSYLVNLAYCSSVKGDSLFIFDNELKITRSFKKEFFDDLSKYFAKCGG